MKTKIYLAPEMEVLDVQVEGQIFQTSLTSDGVYLYDFTEEEF